MANEPGAQDPTPRNVSVEQFNALEGKVDKFNGLLEKLVNSQPATPPTPKQDPEPPTPEEPKELGGFNLEQIQAMAAENKARTEQDRQTALTAAAKENGIELDDSLSAMILNSSKTTDDIAANIKSLAGLKTSTPPNTDPGFSPDGDHTAQGVFGDALAASFGKTTKE